ncbi:MAG: hypothetical protein QOG20_1014, partial [Pseudonocardiales bacterium]|nr:hypothetical protein [Pseudonocardiales bacterium]
MNAEAIDVGTPATDADDSAAPLDLLLTDGALGPLRRLLPG